MIEGHDGMMMIATSGYPPRMVELSYGPGMAPRLLGDGCGCRREGSREVGWTVHPCRRHAEEMCKR